MGKFQIVGVHRLDMSSQLIRLWADYQSAAPNGERTTWDDFPDAEPESIVQRIAEVSVWLFETMRDAYLIEVIVDAPAATFDFAEVGQDLDIEDGSRQAVYDEHYLALDGESLCAVPDKPPPGPRFRAAFFLHDVDLQSPLRTPLGPAALPKPTPMPERLVKLVPYDPPT